MNVHTHSRIVHCVAVIVICAAAVLTYANSFDCAFQFDDAHAITDNEKIRDLKAFTAKAMWTKINGRAVAYLTLAINYYLHEYQLFGYHMANLLFHSLAGIAVYAFICMVLQTPGIRDQGRVRAIAPIAGFTALIFVVHPIQTQAVTYIVQRMTVLAALFYVLAMCCYIRGRLAMHSGGLRSTALPWFVLVLFFGAAGILSKQNAASFPLAILVIEFVLLRNPAHPRTLPYFLLAAVAMVLSAAAVIAVTGISTGSSPTTDLSRGEYIFAALRAIVRYVKLLLLPVNQNLDYDMDLRPGAFHPAQIGTVIVIGILVFVACRSWRRDHILTFGILWMFVALSVESFVVDSLYPVNEHRMYLAMPGAVLIVVHLCFQLLQSSPRTAYIALAAVTVSHAAAAHRRNLVWKTPVSLWGDAVSKAPGKARAAHNLGFAYAKAGDPENALVQYRNAVELDAEYADAHVSLGKALLKIDDLDGAIRHFETAHLLEPKNVDVLNHLGSIRNRRGEAEKAIVYYSRVVEIDPTYVHALFNIANAWRELGNIDQAIRYYKLALEQQPDYVDALNNLGTLYSQSGDTEAAAQCFRKSIAIKPRYGNALLNLADLEAAAGRFEAAIPLYEQFLAMSPRNAMALEHLGWAQQVSGDLDKAIIAYKQALEVDPGRKTSVQNLLTVYDKLQRYEDAYPVALAAKKQFPGDKHVRKNVAVILKKHSAFEQHTPTATDESR